MVEQLSMSCPFSDDKGLYVLSQNDFYLVPVLWLSSYPQLIVLLTYVTGPEKTGFIYM